MYQLIHQYHISVNMTSDEDDYIINIQMLIMKINNAYVQYEKIV